MSEPVDMHIVVVERDRPDYGDIKFALRRWASDVSEGFARWLASPAAGRFLIIQIPAQSAEEAVWNCSAEVELLEQIGRRYLAFREMNRHSSAPAKLSVGDYVTPEIHEKLQRLDAEIRALEADARRSRPPPAP